MLLHNLFVLCNRGQIHDLVLFYQKLIIGQELSYLLICQDNSNASQPLRNVFSSIIFVISPLLIL